MNENVERIRYVTRYYGMLQGLKALPFGLLIIAVTMRDMGAATAATLLLFIAVALFFATERYYANHFGKVQLHSRLAQLRETVIFLVIFIVVVVLENILLLPFSLIGTSIAVFFFVLGFKMKIYYYYPLSAILLLASFLPWMLGVPLTDRVFGSLGYVLSMTIGVVLLISGLLDHLRLMRVIQPVSGGLNEEPK